MKSNASANMLIGNTAFNRRFSKKTKRKLTATNYCVTYERVSSSDQVKGTSLEGQEEANRRYAESRGWEIVQRFGGDFESAKTDERREFSKMIDFCKASMKTSKRISYIVVFTIDRFSRTGGNAIYLSESLRELGIRVVSATQPFDTFEPTGELNQNMLLLFSKYDNDQRRFKTVEALIRRLREGKWVNRPPLGYEPDREKGKGYVRFSKHAPAIKRAFEMRGKEHATIEKVQQWLHGNGIKIHRRNLVRMLANPFYIGLIASPLLNENEIVQGLHKPLISEELFLKANGKINNGGYKVKKENDELPLKTFLKCDHCGSNMRGYVAPGDKWYYKCNNRKCQRRPNKSAANLHERFQGALSRLMVDKKFLPLIAQEMRAMLHEGSQSSHDDREAIKARISEINAKLDKLDDRLLDGELPREVYDKGRERFTAEISELEGKLGQQGMDVSKSAVLIDKALEMAANLPFLWASAGYYEKQRLQKLVFPDGIRYNKEKDVCLIPRFNSVFTCIAELARLSAAAGSAGLVENERMLPLCQFERQSRTGFIRSYITVLDCRSN